MSINNLIKFRKGIATEWSGQNPILASGEPGYDGTNNILKVGDGDTAWNDLEDVVGLRSGDLSTSLVGGTGIHLGYDSVTDQLSINVSGTIDTSIDFNGNNITASTGNFDVISFNIDNESVLTKGQLSWDDTEGSLDIGLTDNTTIHVGEHRYFRIRNETGATLYKGQVVYATGVHSNGLITPDKYVADGSIREVRFMGVVLEDVNHQNNGYVIDFGHVEDIDLDGSATNFATGSETWNDGDILYAHPTSAGKLTNVKPKHAIAIAIILDTGTGNGNGRMFVRPTTFGDLNDNHDVNVGSVTDGQFLQYDSSTDYWVPSSSGNFTTLELNGSGVLVEHPTISAASSVDNSNGNVIQDITLDSNGHVTALGSVNLDSRYYTETEIDSFNYVDGNGTASYLPKWSDTDTLTNSVIYDDGTNIGIGTASPVEKLDVNGSIKTRTGGIGHEDDGCYVAYPGGGSLRNTGSTQTGYLKITLPVSWTNTMISFDIDVYEYAVQKIKKFRVGGYTYSAGSSWIHESAMMDSDNDFAKYKVHFGHDGTNCAIYISEIDSNNTDLGSSTTWSYAQVSVSNIYAGYSSTTMNSWASGWDIDFTTTLGTTTGSIEVSRPYRQHDTSYVFNEYGGNVDFRVEGDADTHLLFTDASSDRVGIGTASPGYKLDVNGTFSANSINVNDAFTFPTTDGSADQYLKTDGLGNVTWSTIAGGGGGISNVVEDTTPQLGGTLDLNGNNIEGYAFQTTPTGTIIGASGWIYQSGQQILSNGSFGTHIGDAQFTQNILRAQTTDATLTNLTIGTQSGILLASNRTYNFTVNVVGRRTNGQDNAGYKLEGLLVNDYYGTSLLGTPVKTTYYESDTNWDVQVSVTGAGSGGTDYLLVQCKGVASQDINWVAHADMLEVGGSVNGYSEANILGLSSDTIP